MYPIQNYDLISIENGFFSDNFTFFLKSCLGCYLCLQYFRVTVKKGSRWRYKTLKFKQLF